MHEKLDPALERALAEEGILEDQKLRPGF